MTCKERAMKIENSSQRPGAVQTADAESLLPFFK